MFIFFTSNFVFLGTFFFWGGGRGGATTRKKKKKLMLYFEILITSPVIETKKNPWKEDIFIKKTGG